MFIDKKFQKLLEEPFNTSLEMQILYMEFVSTQLKNDYMNSHHPKAVFESLIELRGIKRNQIPGEKFVLNMSKDSFKQRIYEWTNKIIELDKKDDFVDSNDFEGLFKLIFDQ